MSTLWTISRCKDQSEAKVVTGSWRKTRAKGKSLSEVVAKDQSEVGVVIGVSVAKFRAKGRLVPLRSRTAQQRFSSVYENFQRFPQTVHSQNVVIGSSALRVCA